MRGTLVRSALMACLLAAFTTDVQAKSFRPPLAVMDLQPRGVEPLVAEILTESVVGALRELRVFNVISRSEIRQMLAIDKERQLVDGACAETSCLAEVGSALGARYLVVGQVTLLDRQQGRLNVTVQLFDMRRAQVAAQESRDVDSVSEAREIASTLALAIVRPMLDKEQGFLELVSRENGARVSIDGRLVGVTPLPVTRLGWGPHRVVVEKEGFIAWARDVQIERNQATTEVVTLIPSPDFLEAYRTRNRLYRVGTWTATALAVAGIGGAGYLQFGRIAPLEEQFEPLQRAFEQPNDLAGIAQACSAAEQAGGSAGIGSDTAACHRYAKGLAESGSRYLLYSRIALGAGVVAAGAAVYFWLAGDDPGRYEQFVESEPEATFSPTASVVPVDRGAMTTVSFSF